MKWSNQFALRLTALVALGLLFFSGLQHIEPLASVQLTYFPQALRVAGEAGYANDWFANTTPTHPVYFAVAAGAEWLGVLSTANLLGAALVFVAGLAAIFLQGAWVHASLASRGWVFAQRVSQFDFALLGLLAAVAAFYVRQVVGVYLDEPLRLSFAYQTIPSALLFENTSFALVIYLGLALLPFEKFRLAGVCLALGAVFHISYLLHAAAAVAVASTWLFLRGRTSDAFALAIPFAGLTILPVAYAVWMRFGGDEASAGMFERLARERIAHHVFPEVFWRGAWNWIAAGMIVTTSLLMLALTAGPLRWVFAIATAYALGGVFYISQTEHIGVALLFPWRAGTFLIPAASVFLILVCLAAALNITCSVFDRFRRVGLAVSSAALVVISVVSIALIRSHPSFDAQPNDKLKSFAEEVRSVTEPADTIIVPEDWASFRAQARRAIFVDVKSHPFREVELREWFSRLEANRAFYELPHEGRLVRCLDLSATHFADVRPPDGRVLPGEDLAVGKWALYRCDVSASG